MKILLVHTSDYLHHPVISRQHHICEILAGRGHEVHAAHFHVCRSEGRKTKLIVNEATLVPFTSPLLHYTFNAPYHYFIFDKIMRENKIDIVVTSNVLASSAAIRAAKKYKTPVIFDLSDWLPDSAAAYIKNAHIQNFVRNAVYYITDKNLRDSTAITTVSPSLIRKIKSMGYDSELITNGVNTDIFKPLDATKTRHEIGINADDFVIGFAGSIETWYDIDSMIRAMPEILKTHPKTKLLIVGSALFTDCMDKTIRTAISVGVLKHTIFTGMIPHEELPRYIACMDVCTIPLDPPQWADIALPTKYFEYSACEKPILMRHMPEVEKMGGNLFVYSNQNEYVEHITDMINNPPKLIPVEKHSWAEKAKQFEKLMKTLTEKT